MAAVFQEPLEYDHLGETVDVNGVSLEARAEVAVLSRSILFRGSDNMEWHDEIEACPQGFDPGNNCMILNKISIDI